MPRKSTAIGLVQPRMAENGRGEMHVAFQCFKIFWRRSRLCASGKFTGRKFKFFKSKWSFYFGEKPLRPCREGARGCHGHHIAATIRIAPGMEIYPDCHCAARLNGASIFRVGSTRKIGANGIFTGMRHPRAENKVNAIASAYQHYIRTGNLSIHATMHVG